MKCAQCPGFTLCLVCFAVGAELAPHKAGHDYHLFRSARFPLYVRDWGADEELLLLEGVALCGLGNWVEVAQHVGTKTSEECRSHFFAAFVESPDYPTPVAPLPEAEIRAALPMPPAVPVQEKKVVYKPGLSLPVKGNLGSFMPLRHEFDSPYNEDAEDIPADIVFNEDDNEEEREVKVHALQVYTAMLEERKRKTDFLVGYDLLDWKSHQLFDRSLHKDDQHIVSSMRPFLQCQNKAQWERFVNGVLNEQHLRREIASFKSMREAGLKWLSERPAADGRSNSTAGTSRKDKRLKMAALTSDSSRHNLRSSGVLGKPAGALPDPLAALEVEYCEAFGISSEMYLVVKEACIREACRAGSLSKKDARLLAPLPKHQMDQLFLFFLSAGWLGPLSVTLNGGIGGGAANGGGGGNGNGMGAGMNRGFSMAGRGGRVLEAPMISASSSSALSSSSSSGSAVPPPPMVMSTSGVTDTTKWF